MLRLQRISISFPSIGYVLLPVSFSVCTSSFHVLSCIRRTYLDCHSFFTPPDLPVHTVGRRKTSSFTLGLQLPSHICFYQRGGLTTYRTFRFGGLSVVVDLTFSGVYKEGLSKSHLRMPPIGYLSPFDRSPTNNKSISFSANDGLPPSALLIKSIPEE